MHSTRLTQQLRPQNAAALFTVIVVVAGAAAAARFSSGCDTFEEQHLKGGSLGNSALQCSSVVQGLPAARGIRPCTPTLLP